MNENKDVIKRLDILIRLFLEQQLQEGKLKRKNQIALMDSVGLTSGDIGKILGQPSKDVASQINRIKKEQKKTSSKNDD